MKWKFYIPALLIVLVVISWGQACPDTAPDYCQTYYDGAAYQCCCTLSTDGTTYIDTCDHSLFVFSLVPDSLSALRVGSFNYSPDATHKSGSSIGGFAKVLQVTPDSLSALRLGSFNFGPNANYQFEGNAEGIVRIYLSTPDSLVALRLGSFDYGPNATRETGAGNKGGIVGIYITTPDSLVALRLGSFNYGPDATLESGTGKGGFADIYIVTPDSLVALRLGSFNYNPDANYESGTSKGGFADIYIVTPDSLVALRLGSFRYEPPADSSTVPGYVMARNRKLFIFVWEGKVYVLTDPPFGWFTADDTLYFSADSFLWAGLSNHTLDLPDTLQLAPDSLQRRFWYHFLYWTSDRGDTNTSRQWIITVPDRLGLGGITYTAHFDVDPAIRSRLKGGLWFDPRGRKKGFNPNE